MVSSKLFSYNKEDKTFRADVSDTAGKLTMVRAYPDACDAGFDMVSHKTGEVCRFVETGEKRNSDNEVMYWEFSGMGKVGKGLKVVLFND